MIQIDNSQLQTFIDCPRKYRNKYILKLKKISFDESDVDREFGRCFHKALEILYTEKDLQKAKAVFRTMNTIETEKAKTPLNGEQLVEAHWNYWNQPVNMLSDTNLETIAVEQVLTFPLSDDVEWLVKLDRIAKNSAGIWSVESKTTSSIAYNYFLKFDPNTQISGQCEAIRLKYGQCSGAIINAVGIGFRQKAYKGQPAGFWCEFSRDIINRNEEQLRDFRTNALHWVKRLRQSLETNTFCKNESHCHSYKGCAYRQLCISVDDESVKETLYTVDPDPLAYLKEEK